jgi:hypothetical protein
LGLLAKRLISNCPSLYPSPWADLRKAGGIISAARLFVLDFDDG